ncbi:MAG: radical SAM protein, partial [Termitinemataceae bacterium]
MKTEPLLGWDNPPWDKAELKLLFVRLSPWEEVQRSSTHLFLYSLMRHTLGNRVYGDFAVLPSKGERRYLDDHNASWLRGHASGKEAVEFDVLLISCSYALELVNLPLLLVKSGIPLRALERRLATSQDGACAAGTGQGRRWPLILLGGSNSLACQAVLFPDGDSFVDGIYFGEAEAQPGGAELFQILAEQRDRETTAQLTALEAALPCFWATGQRRPDATDPEIRLVYPARSKVSDEPFLPVSYPILNTEEASTGRFQISWGCPSFCSFCFEGWERKPFRELPRERLRDLARRFAAGTGASTIELYSFNFNAHKDILPILYDLNQIFDRVNMMSQRADILINTPGMLECELAAEKRSYTIGVEGISPGMRAYYQKGLSDTDLWKLIQRLYKERVREIKLFYIIAGIETDDDLKAFTGFCQRLQELSELHNPSPRIIFSAGYLVRMPFTPLQFAPLCLDRSRMEGLGKRLKETVEGAGFEFRLAMNWQEYVADQRLVLGDYSLALGLEQAALKGVVYDDGIQGDLLAYLAPCDEEEKPADYRFPLAFVRPAIDQAYRYRIYEASRNRIERPTCFGSKAEPGRCQACKACKNSDEQRVLNHHTILEDGALQIAEKLNRLIKQKRRMQARYLLVELPEAYAGWQREYLGALLLKQVLSKQGDLIGRLFRIEEGLWSRYPWDTRIGQGAWGKTVLALYGINQTAQSSEPTILGDRDLALAAEALGDLNPQPIDDPADDVPGA